MASAYGLTLAPSIIHTQHMNKGDKSTNLPQESWHKI